MKRIAKVASLVIAAIVALSLLAVGAFRLMPADFRSRRLLNAAAENNTTKIKALLWLGADVNFSTGSGTALHGAAYNGNIPLMTFLIEHGATVDQAAKFGITPLWEARMNHQLAAEQLLLAHGANPDTSHINPP
jgi:ankyrin repeat protein